LAATSAHRVFQLSADAVILPDNNYNPANDGLVTTNLGLFADEGTTTLSPGDKIRVISCENSTSEYSQIKEYEIPETKGTFRTPDLACAPYGNLTLTNLNENDQPNTDCTLGASESKDTGCKIKADLGTADAAYGNPFHQASGNSVCFSYTSNATMYTRVALAGSTSAPVPKDLDNPASSDRECWYWTGKKVLEDNDDVIMGLEISTSTSQPNGQDVTDINVTTYDTALDLNADLVNEGGVNIRFKPIFGFFDENNADIGNEAQGSAEGNFHNITSS